MTTPMRSTLILTLTAAFLFWATGCSGESETSEPTPVASQAQRPSIINWGDRLMVVFERPTSTGVDIVLHQNFGGSGYHEQVVAKVGPGSHPDPMIHRVGSTIWLDWRAAPGQYEWARMAAGRFSVAGSLTWADRSWQGDQEARSQIRNQVLGSR